MPAPIESQINWGIIGYGNIAKKFEENIKNINLNKLYAISTKKITSGRDLIVYDKEIELLKNKKVNSIYISNINSQHFSSAMNCLKNSKNFIIEKPSFIDLEEAEDFVRAANESNCFFIESYMNLYHPQIDLVLSLIREKEIGYVKNISATFGFDITNSILKRFIGFPYYRFKKNHRLLDKKNGGGAIFDLGCYLFSLANKIAKLDMINLDYKITDVKGKFGRTDDDEHAQATIKFKNSIIANIECSFLKNLDNKVRIYGSEGVITINQPWVPNHNAEIIIETTIGKKIIKTGTDKNIHFYEIDFFNKILKDIFLSEQIKKIILNEVLENTVFLVTWLKILRRKDYF